MAKFPANSCDFEDESEDSSDPTFDVFELFGIPDDYLRKKALVSIKEKMSSVYDCHSLDFSEETSLAKNCEQICLILLNILQGLFAGFMDAKAMSFSRTREMIFMS